MPTPIWDRSFAPSYTPKEMLEAGVFEGKYINIIEGLPVSWYKLRTVVKPGCSPDVSINKFGVKSRLPLSEWQAKNWILTDAGGWFHWYCLYFNGRRLGDEDTFQINRWRSFVARHQGQITKSGNIKDLSARRKQRQALLQWGWDSTKKWTPQQRAVNLKRLSSFRQVKLK